MTYSHGVHMSIVTDQISEEFKIPLVGTFVRFCLKQSSMWHEGIVSTLTNIDGNIKNITVILDSNFRINKKFYFLEEVQHCHPQ